jgi:parallel beta-helix repeat protein
MIPKWAVAIFVIVAVARANEIQIKVGPGAQFATLDAALSSARADRKTGDTVRVNISGTHYLQKPIILSEADSGTTLEGNGALSGGRILKGARKGAGALWEWEIPEVRQGKWYFRQLFVNSQRRQRARTPNAGFFRIQGESPKDKPAKLKFKPGDIKKAWAVDGDVEVVAYLAWADLRMQIRAVDQASSVATLSGDPRPSNQEVDAKYIIENAPDALDQPGEWYLDRRTGMLRYWPLPGEDISKAEVIAPFLEELVTVRGNAGSKKAAENITIRGLTFSHTDYKLATNGIADTQAAVEIRGDLLFEFARNCVIENCHFVNLAGYGIELGRGAQHIKIQRCEVFDVGGGGVRIGETTRHEEPFDANHSNEVLDCEIHKLGRIFASAIGVFILQSGTNRVAHNHISDLYYTAVSVGWNWGYHQSPCHANIVEFNHLHDIGQSLLSDMGAVYTLGIQPGTIIRNNMIHDVSAFTYGGWGLYTDEGSSEILLENNLVYRCKSAGFHQHYGRENIIRNNIFAFDRECQLARSREEAHSSFTIERNIIYFNSGDLLGSVWSNDKFTINNNIYFDTRTTNITFQGATLAQWRARGHDRNSVIADPLFRDAGHLDFRFKENSPALKMGFKPIDLSTIGPRK